MNRTLSLVAAVVFGLTLPGCHPGSGYAERVDVPLSVSIRRVGEPITTCGPLVCHIGYAVVISDEGDRAVVARDCVVRGLGRDRHQVFEAIFGSGIGPGAETEPGKPYRARGTFSAKVTKEEMARVRSLEGTCLAYIWHGTIPI